MRGATLSANLKMVPLWDVLKGKAFIQRSSTVQKSELMGALSLVAEQLCCKSPGVLVGDKGGFVIWGPGLSSLMCRQSVWENACSPLISTYNVTSGQSM